jgi:phosphoserine phosphatase
MTKLHIFDMDGTLLAGSACLEISRHLGQLEEVMVIEEAWGRGEVGHVAFYELCLPLWDGLTEDDIDEVFRSSIWLAGIVDVWDDIAQRGEYSAVITLSPQFFVQRLLEWGLHTAHGARVLAGVAPDPADVLTPESKVDIAQGLLDEYGLRESDCVGYGDSSSDVPLFDFLTNTVAINGSESIRAQAAASYKGDDIRHAYAIGRLLLDGRSTPT